MADLTLFKKDSCPYCQKVMRYMAQEGIQVPMKDIVFDPSAREELVRTGGKQQVPCLFIDGEPLYESDDIIAYLRAQR